MKRISLIGAGLFVLLSACNNSETKESAEKKSVHSDLVLENLKGSVASFEETPYKVDSSGKPGEMDSCCIGVAEYNEDGNGTKYTERDSKGTVKSESVFTRYENGMWKGSKDTRDGKTSGSFNTEQDDKGQYILAQAFDSTGKLDKYYTNITQNEYGQVLTWKEYDKDSVFRQEGETKYEDKRQVAFTLKDSVGKVKSSSAMKYNEKGEQVEVSRTNVTKDSTTTKVTTYTYDAHDEQGNWTQRTEYDDKGKPKKVVKRVYSYRAAKDEKE